MYGYDLFNLMYVRRRQVDFNFSVVELSQILIKCSLRGIYPLDCDDT